MTTRWNNNLQLGNEKVDAQHKSIFDQVDKFAEAMSQGKGRAELTKMLDFMENYVIEHFRDEEEYMRKIQFPKINEHIDAHNKFVQDVVNMKAEFEDIGPSTYIAVQISSRIGEWLSEHIATMDREIQNYKAV